MKTITKRGFSDYGTFKDSYGAEVTVRQSSSAEENAVWVFIKGGSVENNNGAMHLDIKQAIKLRANLAEWLSDIEETNQ